MKRHWAYLLYLIRHKWGVFLECCKLGIPWLGIIHDWSKFLPSEWMAYVRTLYEPDGTPRPFRKPNGEWNKEIMAEEWKCGLLHHLSANKHHWQYWMLLDAGPTWEPLPMPDRYRREMLADWRAAGKQLGLLDTVTWYERNRERIILHRETRQWIEERMQS